MKMDNHLNLFWHYGRLPKEAEEKDRSINGLENNVTRSTIVTFKKLNRKNKICFINKLLEPFDNGDVLSYDLKYDFEYELQGVEHKDEIKKANTENKYLVGFCPDGSVRVNNKEVTINEKEILELVDSQPVDKDANPDATIIVKDANNKSIVLVVTFENKKESLYPDQLKRHLVDYLGVSTAKEHLIVKNYNDFYGLFNIFMKDSCCEELVEYLNMLFLLTPGFNHLKEAYSIYCDDKEEMKKIADRTLFGTLKEAYTRLNENESFGELRIQKGWGNIIDITKQFKYINMIGLVWSKDEELIELNIKLAPNMESAESFYKEFELKDLLSNNNELGFSSWFTFGDVHNYIDGTEIIFKDVEKYFNYFKATAENNDMKSVGNKDGNDSLRKLLEEMYQQIGPFDGFKSVESIIQLVTKTKQGEERKDYKNNKIWYAPSIQVTKKWTIQELIKIGPDKLVSIIVDTIEKTRCFFGPIKPKK